MLQCFAVRCSALQCVAECCSVLQCRITALKTKNLHANLYFCVYLHLNIHLELRMHICYCLCECVLVFCLVCYLANNETGVVTSYYGLLRLVGSLKLPVSFAEYRLFHRALLQKRHVI